MKEQQKCLSLNTDTQTHSSFTWFLILCFCFCFYKLYLFHYFCEPIKLSFLGKIPYYIGQMCMTLVYIKKEDVPEKSIYIFTITDMKRFNFKPSCPRLLCITGISWNKEQSEMTIYRSKENVYKMPSIRRPRTHLRTFILWEALITTILICHSPVTNKW